ncbi:MAG: hypothetical protein WKF80_11780 [Thermomicrobiales bacterium]
MVGRGLAGERCIGGLLVMGRRGLERTGTPERIGDLFPNADAIMDGSDVEGGDDTAGGAGLPRQYGGG